MPITELNNRIPPIINSKNEYSDAPNIIGVGSKNNEMIHLTMRSDLF